MGMDSTSTMEDAVVCADLLEGREWVRESIDTEWNGQKRRALMIVGRLPEMMNQDRVLVTKIRVAEGTVIHPKSTIKFRLMNCELKYECKICSDIEENILCRKYSRDERLQNWLKNIQMQESEIIVDKERKIINEIYNLNGDVQNMQIVLNIGKNCIIEENTIINVDIHIIELIDAILNNRNLINFTIGDYCFLQVKSNLTNFRLIGSSVSIESNCNIKNYFNIQSSTNIAPLLKINGNSKEFKYTQKDVNNRNYQSNIYLLLGNIIKTGTKLTSKDIILEPRIEEFELDFLKYINEKDEDDEDNNIIQKNITNNNRINKVLKDMDTLISFLEYNDMHNVTKLNHNFIFNIIKDHYIGTIIAKNNQFNKDMDTQLKYLRIQLPLYNEIIKY